MPRQQTSVTAIATVGYGGMTIDWQKIQGAHQAPGCGGSRSSGVPGRCTAPTPQRETGIKMRNFSPPQYWGSNMSTLVRAAGSEHFCGRTNQGELRSSEQARHLDHSKGYHESLSIMICFSKEADARWHSMPQTVMMS